VGDTAGSVEKLPSAEAGPQQQGALVIEVSDVNGCPPEQTMRRRHRGEDADRKQLASFEPIVTSAKDQAKIHLAALDKRDAAHATLLLQVDIDAGTPLQVPAQERRQHALNHLWRAAHAKAPNLAVVQRARVLGQLLGARQHLTAPAQEAFALTREAHPAPVALEEPDAQLRLEIVNLSPQGRLRDAQASGRPGERARLRDGDEVTEVSELHGGLLPARHRLLVILCIGQAALVAPSVEGEGGHPMWNIERFVTDCRAALAEATPERAIKEVLERAIADPAGVVEALGTPRQAQLTPIHHDRDLTILNVVWTPGMAVYPHDHRMWALIGLYAGREDNTFYRRSPGGLQVAGGKELETGDTTLLGKTVIHAVVNPLRVFAGAIHIYGGDFFSTPRSDWDPATLEERPYDVARARKVVADANERWLAECAISQEGRRA